MTEKNQNSGGYLGGLVVGVLIGAGAALLLAPKRGEELRDELAQNASQWKDKAAGSGSTLSERAQELKDRATELSHTVSQKAQDLKNKGQDTLGQVGKEAEEVAEVAKEAADDAQQDAKKSV